MSENSNPPKCSECKKGSEVGGFVMYDDKKIHTSCLTKLKKKRRRIDNIRNFFSSNWKFWIMLGLGIIGLLIAKELI